MVYRPRYRKYRRTGLKRRAGRRPARKGVSMNVRRYVKRTIHKNIENKTYDQPGAIVDLKPWLPASSPGGAGTAIPLMPQLAQSLSSGGRVGNKVKILSSFLNISIATKSSNVYPTTVILYFVTSRRITSQGTNLDVPDYNDFFKYGGTEVTFQGNSQDLNLTINSDILKLHTKRVVQLATYDVTNGRNICDSNSRTMWNLHIPLTKYYHGLLHYNDNESSFPTNRNLYCVIQPIFNNLTDTVANTAMAVASWNYHCTYEDA